MYQAIGRGRMIVMKLLNKDEFIANEIKYYFIKNNIKEGDKLPSERELADVFGVQRATVRAAYNILEEEGIIGIEGAQRKDTWVIPGLRLIYRKSSLSAIKCLRLALG